MGWTAAHGEILGVWVSHWGGGSTWLERFTVDTVLSPLAGEVGQMDTKESCRDGVCRYQRVTWN